MFQVVAFDLSIRVTPDSALHDRISLDLGEWTVTEDRPSGDDSQELQNFANLIAAPLADEECADPSSRLLFNRPTGINRGMRTLICRKKAKRHFPFPPSLLRGKLMAFVSITRGARQIRVFSFRGKFHLNATRYLRQLRPRYRARPRLGPEDQIFTVSHRRRADEFSLDREDNWLPADAEGRVIGTAEEAHEVSALSYIERIWRRIEHEIRHAANAYATTFSRTVRWQPSRYSVLLSQVETYWEFFHPEPLQLVESMKSAARQHTASYRLSRYDEGTTGQSLSISMTIRKGVKLRIYAKTNRRIRIEVEHDLKPMRFRRSPDEADPISGLRTMLAYLREDAAQVVNGFLNNLVSPPMHPSQSRTPLALLVEIVAATREFNLATLLCESLCIHRCYRVGINDPLQPAILFLKEKGVLQNRRRSSVYLPSPTWANAVTLLSDVGRLDPLLYLPALVTLRQRQRAR